MHVSPPISGLHITERMYVPAEAAADVIAIQLRVVMGAGTGSVRLTIRHTAFRDCGPMLAGDPGGDWPLV